MWLGISAWFLLLLVMHSARADDPRAVGDEPSKLPKTIVVAKSGDSDFKTIQAAVDAAPANGVIQIGEGRFAERLTIDKPLTLVGAGIKTVIGRTEPLLVRPFEEDPPRFEGVRRSIQAAQSNQERDAIMREFFEQYFAPTISISHAGAVELRTLRLTLPSTPTDTNGLLGGVAVVRVSDAHARLDKCAIVGSIGDGISVGEDADVELRDCLIAACWHAGIFVGTGFDDNARAKIVGCDVRNCFYAGIVIDGDAGRSSIERCRISGSAWHGVRYDDDSPEITGNAIFQNARCGIYGVRNTKAKIKANLIYKNGWDGIACLAGNYDSIEQNLFLGNGRVGISVAAEASPTIKRNIFMQSPVGILFASYDIVDTIRIEKNFFSEIRVEAAVRVRQPNLADWHHEPIPLDAAAGRAVDPRIAVQGLGDVTVADDSPAIQDGIGVAQPLSIQSPWPLTAEEKAMIPDGDTRDSSKWKVKQAPPPPANRRNPAVPAA